VCKTDVIIPEKESTLTVLDNFLSRSATQHFIEIGVAVPGIKESLKQADRQTEKTSVSNYRLVLYGVRFLLGNSPASEFYMPTFRNTLSVPSS
jgi:hypothetical protein